MTSVVRTVLGDIPPGELGVTDYHEHLFQASPLLPDDDLDDEEASGAEAATLVGAGVTAIVDATPIGLGRRPTALARISEGAALTVVMTTGVHKHEHYANTHELLKLDAESLSELFISEIQRGVLAVDESLSGRSLLPGDLPIRAGVVKAGIGYWSIDPWEREAIRAVSDTHLATGATVMIHLEHGSAGHEVLDLLEGWGVSPRHVILAHVDRNPDAVLLAEWGSRGAYLGFDGAARHKSWPDSVIVDCLVGVAQLGFSDRILVGGDVARRSRFESYGGMPGMAYLPRRFFPRIAAQGGDELLRAATVMNPARALAFEPR